MNADDSVGRRLGQMMDESVRLARAAWSTVALYVAAMTAMGAVVDQLPDVGAGSLISAVVSIGLGFVLTVNLLRGGGLAPAGLAAGFGSYFGLSLLSSLGMVLGLLLLVIPGLVLFVRWAPAYGYVLVDGDRVTEGLGKSWAQTGVHFWPLALALLPPVALNLGAGAVYLLATDEQGMISVPVSVLANGAMSAAGAAITVVGIAGYALLRNHAVAGVAAAQGHEVTEDLEATVEATVLLSAMGFENGGLSIAHSTTRGLMNLRGARERLHGEHVAYGTLVQIAAEGRPQALLVDLARFLLQVGLPTSLAELGVADASRAELEGIASAIMASPHAGNVAEPLSHSGIVAALALIEAQAARGWHD